MAELGIILSSNGYLLEQREGALFVLGRYEEAGFVPRTSVPVADVADVGDIFAITASLSVPVEDTQALQTLRVAAGEAIRNGAMASPAGSQLDINGNRLYLPTEMQKLSAENQLLEEFRFDRSDPSLAGVRSLPELAAYLDRNRAAALPPSTEQAEALETAWNSIHNEPVFLGQSASDLPDWMTSLENRINEGVEEALQALPAGTPPEALNLARTILTEALKSDATNSEGETLAAQITGILRTHNLAEPSALLTLVHEYMAWVPEEQKQARLEEVITAAGQMIQLPNVPPLLASRMPEILREALSSADPQLLNSITAALDAPGGNPMQFLPVAVAWVKNAPDIAEQKLRSDALATLAPDMLTQLPPELKTAFTPVIEDMARHLHEFTPEELQKLQNFNFSAGLSQSEALAFVDELHLTKPVRDFAAVTTLSLQQAQEAGSPFRVLAARYGISVPEGAFGATEEEAAVAYEAWMHELDAKAQLEAQRRIKDVYDAANATTGGVLGIYNNLPDSFKPFALAIVNFLESILGREIISEENQQAAEVIAPYADAAALTHERMEEALEEAGSDFASTQTLAAPEVAASTDVQPYVAGAADYLAPLSDDSGGSPAHEEGAYYEEQASSYTAQNASYSYNNVYEDSLREEYGEEWPAEFTADARLEGEYTDSSLSYLRPTAPVMPVEELQPRVYI